MSFPTYFEAFDAQQMLRDYPIGDEFVRRYKSMSKDELFAIQDAQFKKLMQRGWRSLSTSGSGARRGLSRAIISGLADITKLPVYDKSDLMASIADHPPYGDFHGLGAPEVRTPSVFHPPAARPASRKC